jgi:hypothetical protein
MKKHLPVCLFTIILAFSACHSNDYAPKPRGYFHIDFPKKAYKNYDGGCAFSFD